VKDDEIYIFYSGACEPSANSPQSFDISPVKTGIAKLERGRLSYLASADQMTTAVVTTIPLAVSKNCNAQLKVNAGELLAYRDWIEAEVLDARTNEPIEGYTKRDCQDLYSDGFDIPVRWKGSKSLRELQDRAPIKLRFFLYGKARLYSFSFAAPNDAKSAART
jgi:hypothetical protein